VVGWDTDFSFDGQSPDDARRNPNANYETIHPHYFRVLGIPIKAGREFDSHDKSDGQKVAIINETMAARFFGSARNAVGKRINVGLGGWMTIVGVAGDVRYRELQNTRVDIYAPHAQSAPALNHYAVRTTLGAANALALVRREVAALDPQQAVSRVATMDELVATQLARPRFSAVLLNWLSGLAVLLAAVGIFGVMAYSVARRSAEIGVRIALGAQGSDILKLVIGQGMRLVAVGVVIGLAASFALTRLVAKLLYGVSATDLLTFSVIAALLTFVALLACYIPARRATKVDPMIALRTD
jgi:putative ABC transport system permease protein